SGPAKTPRVDRYGDPLPPGALARMGTVRLRHRQEVWSVLFSPDGKVVYASGPAYGEQGHTGELRVWDASTGKPVRRFEGERFPPFHLCLSPDGKLIAGTHERGPLRVWELETGRIVCRIAAAQADDIWSATFSPDGKVLATIGNDTPLHVW